MKALRALIAENEDWLVGRVLGYAKRHGYTQFSSTLAQPWRESICGFSEPLLRSLDETGLPMELPASGDYLNEPIAEFALTEARLHRQRGVPLSLFLGLTKYYRQCYLDLVLEQDYPASRRERYRLFIERFFDHIEIAFCSEWTAVGEGALLAEAQAQNRLLVNEKNKYLTIFESLNDPVILIDDHGRIANLNHAAADLFGDGAVPGQGYYGAQDYPLLADQLEGLIAPETPASRRERKLETRHGPRDFEVKSQRLLDVSEKLAGTVLILSDVTAYRRAEQQADAASRAKSTFLATMSHEIRTPITGILGIGRLLQDGALTEAQRGYVGALVSSGEVLLALVNDVLDYSKIEAETLEAERAVFDPRAVVAQVAQLVTPTAEGKGLALSVRIDDDLPQRILGDQAMVRRILLNLVTNAVKYTAAGSVEVAVSRDGAAVRVGVSDTGIGIPEAIRPMLFAPFTQAEDGGGRPSGGTGLGLAICKKLVTAIGGDIGFESREGSGSSFWFTFPYAAAAESAVTAAASAEGPPLPSLRVLLVEDNEVNRLVTEGFLERDGHSVQVVESGEAAVAAAQAGGIDLVLMDVRMSGIGGLEAIRRIRSLADPEAAAVPILVLTADLATTEEAACLASGADGVLGKPFEPAALAAALARCLSVADARRAPYPDKILEESVLRRHREALGEGRARRIVEAFRGSAPGTLEAIRQSAETGDRAQLSDLAHSLKSAAGNLGLIRLGRTAERLERAAGDGEASALAAAVTRIEADFARSVAALQDVAPLALDRD